MFFDGAKLTRLSTSDSPVYALLRESAEGKDSVLVLANTDAEKVNSVSVPQSALHAPHTAVDLLGKPFPQISIDANQIIFNLQPGDVFCLAPTFKPVGLSGDDYRRVRAQAAFAFEALGKIIPVETVDGLDWHWLAGQVESSPKNFLAAVSEFAARKNKISLIELLSGAGQTVFPRAINWTLIDTRRITLVPPDHWLLIEDSAPFRAPRSPMRNVDDATRNEPTMVHVQSIPAGNSQVACFAPKTTAGEATLTLERHATTSQSVSAAIRYMASEPAVCVRPPRPDDLVLLTNNRGGMARLCVDLGRVNSKYDCVLGANLNPTVPVDRHVLEKRLRVWVNADGFLSALNFKNLTSFKAGSPAVWQFIANAGDGRTVEIELRAEMIEDQKHRRLPIPPAQ